MKNFLLILFNRIFNSTDVAQDRVFLCNGATYHDIKNHRTELHEDNNYFNFLVAKSCSMITKQQISAIPFPRSVLISNQNDIVNMLTQYNNKDYEYQEIDFANTADVLCNGSSKVWSSYISGALEGLYSNICTNITNLCSTIHNQKIFSNSQSLTSILGNNLCNNSTENIPYVLPSDSGFSDDDDITFIDIALLFGPFVAIVTAGFIISSYLKHKYFTHNDNTDGAQNDDTDLQELTVLTEVQVGTPQEEIPMYKAEHSIEETLYDSIDIMGHTGAILN